MEKAIILDTETTDVNDPEPIEIAYESHREGVEDLDNSYSGHFQAYYKPNKPISLGAMAVHHIMDEDVAGCSPYAGFVVPDEVEYLVGHNIDFDWEVIDKPENLKRICTLALSRKLWPDADSHTLSAMLYLLERKTARERLKQAHSALADVRICDTILSHIIVKLQVTTWEELWLASEAARIPERMPFGKHKGTPIKEVPADYLRWLKRQQDVDAYLMKAIDNILL